MCPRRFVLFSTMLADVKLGVIVDVLFSLYFFLIKIFLKIKKSKDQIASDGNQKP